VPGKALPVNIPIKAATRRILKEKVAKDDPNIALLENIDMTMTINTKTTVIIIKADIGAVWYRNTNPYIENIPTAKRIDTSDTVRNRSLY
jgi:hypothetical protein